MVTRNALNDLDKRAAVPASVRNLLRRAKGLDLLEPAVDANYVTELKPLGYKLKHNETFAGYDFEADVDHCMVVLVCESVNYPIEGYPEAYLW